MRHYSALLFAKKTTFGDIHLSKMGCMDDRLLLRFVVYSGKTGLSSVKLIGTKIGWSEILKVL